MVKNIQAADPKPVKALLGTKLGMTQVWDENANLIPVTVVRVGKNVVTQVRTTEVDGYEALQIASGELKKKHVTKPLAGHFAKAGVEPRRHVAEIRTPDAREYTLGQELGVDTFEAGQHIDVVGKSKGKGFAGVMKRHGFAGVSASHGAHRNHQAGFGRCLLHAFARIQRNADGGKNGQCPRHHTEPHDPCHRYRKRSDSR